MKKYLLGENQKEKVCLLDNGATAPNEILAFIALDKKSGKEREITCPYEFHTGSFYSEYETPYLEYTEEKILVSMDQMLSLIHSYSILKGFELTNAIGDIEKALQSIKNSMIEELNDEE